MVAFEFEVLAALGLTPVLASRALGAAPPGEAPQRLVRVTEVHRNGVGVHDGVAERSARPLPRVVRALADDGSALAVGDWVIASADAYGALWIEARVPPTSHIVRRDGDGDPHPVVSNVDTALLVMGLDDDFNPRRLERYLALVQGDGIVPVVVLTKADVCVASSSQALEDRLAQLQGRVPPQVEVLAVNATDPSAGRALDGYLDRGRTLVLLGSSGAGKSTLTNTLLGAIVQDTGAIRAHDSRGRHTTTSRSLHLLPGGACVIDTPGLRTLRPDGGEAALAAAFTDIEALAARCRFRDCGHHQEPGCAVREGIGVDRLRNFHKLLREIRRDAMTALERQQQLAQWKVRSRASKVRMKEKRGA
jgi:ribosome biogenesis GTPase